MKKLSIIPFILMSLVAPPSWGETMDDLVERDGIYYEKFSDIPFTGEIEGSVQGRFKNGKKKGRVDYFGILGIDIGETLTFSKDQSLTCEVKENGQVLFREELTTLSGSALTIVSEMGYNWQQVRGAGYWCYKGTTLLDLYQQSQDG